MFSYCVCDSGSILLLISKYAEKAKLIVQTHLSRKLRLLHVAKSPWIFASLFYCTIFCHISCSTIDWAASCTSRPPSCCMQQTPSTATLWRCCRRAQLQRSVVCCMCLRYIADYYQFSFSHDNEYFCLTCVKIFVFGLPAMRVPN